MQYTIVLPGITGSSLVDRSMLPPETVWDLSSIMLHAPRLADLQLDVGSVDDRRPDVLISPSHPLVMAYRSLFEGLRGRLGAAGADHVVFPFAYDWRRSVVDAAQSLVELVARLVRRSTRDGGAAPRVNLVGHSLGGLVARQFLAEWDAAYPGYAGVVGKLITIGTPHSGSLAIVREMIVGDGGLLQSGREVRKVARTCASAYELLPRYPGALVGPGGADWSLFELKHWQDNVATNSDEDVSQRRLDRARDVLNSLPDPVARLGAHNVLCIAGDAPMSTVRTVHVAPSSENGRVLRWFDFASADDAKDAAGDEVVTIDSSIVTGAWVARMPKKTMTWFGRPPSSLHSTLPSSSEVQTIVHAFLRTSATTPAGVRAALRDRWPVNMDAAQTLVAP
jgi:pimeloyl-ACP methyl ester carboxylesterase